MSNIELQESNGIRLAVEGCGHGTLHAIYASIEEACKQKGWAGIDLLIIGGDFQSVRNAYDLNCVSMPAKYRSICDFHEYYSGQRTAPYLTIFVGGNHEASNYLFELYYGGWVAPNIYYMGAANVLKLGPLRIAGLSGIWKGFDYRKTHLERLPYNESDIKSIYHVRELDVRKLMQIRTQIDIAVSHDWPQGVEWKGNWKRLFNRKKHFQDDARSGRLGSVAAKQVLELLRPRYWFSAHLHCKYAAVVSHGEVDATSQSVPEATGMAKVENPNEINLGFDGSEENNGKPVSTKNEDEIDLDLDDDGDMPKESDLGLHTTPAAAVTTASANADEIDLEMDDNANNHDESQVEPQGSDASNPSKPATSSLEAARAALPASFSRPRGPEPIEHPPDITNLQTNFLALDKCLPHRDFLQLLTAPVESDIDKLRPLRLSYDREWLAITRASALHEGPIFGDPDARVSPARSQAEYRGLIDEQQKWVDEHLPTEEEEQSMVVPENFEPVAPMYDGGDFHDPQYQTVAEYPNPQTASFCKMLQIQNPLEISGEELKKRMAAGPRPDTEMQHFRGGRGRGGRGGGRGGGGGRFRRGGR